MLPPAHHFPQGHVAQKVAQAGVSPQTGNNLGRLTQLGEEARDQALGLGPQGLGLAAGLMSHAPATRCPRSGPCRRRNRTPGYVPSGLKASEKT